MPPGGSVNYTNEYRKDNYTGLKLSENFNQIYNSSEYSATTQVESPLKNQDITQNDQGVYSPTIFERSLKQSRNAPLSEQQFGFTQEGVSIKGQKDLLKLLKIPMVDDNQFILDGIKYKIHDDNYITTKDDGPKKSKFEKEEIKQKQSSQKSYNEPSQHKQKSSKQLNKIEDLPVEINNEMSYADIERELREQLAMEEFEADMKPVIEKQASHQIEHQTKGQKSLRTQLSAIKNESQHEQLTQSRTAQQSDLLKFQAQHNRLSKGFAEESLDMDYSPLKRSITNQKRNGPQAHAQIKQLEDELQKVKEREDVLRKMLTQISSEQIQVQQKPPLHLAFLYASPLVHHYGEKLKEIQEMDQLNFQQEFKEIKTGIKKTENKVFVQSVTATVNNFNQILAKEPIALHFSGHGLQNNINNLGKQKYIERKEEEYFLLFEKEDGEGELMGGKQLDKLLKSYKTNFEFVFVASCTSEETGKIFIKAGAKHVICVQQSEKVQDSAIILFVQTFYHQVFTQQVTICNAFENAKKMVEIRNGPKQAKILQLKIGSDKVKSDDPMDIYSMISEDEQTIKDNHCCRSINLRHLVKGDAQFMQARAKYSDYPPKVQDLQGRDGVMGQVVKALKTDRLVAIMGSPGVGKSAVCRNSVNFVADRNYFAAGVLFFSLKGTLNCEILMKQLLSKMLIQDEVQKKKNKYLKKANAENLLFEQFDKLKEKEEELLLLVFDDADELLSCDIDAFVKLLEFVLNSYPQIHVLMSSRMRIGVIQNITRKDILVPDLKNHPACRMFQNIARDILDDEWQELMAYQSPSDIANNPPKLKVYKDAPFREHPIFKLLSFNPHAITLAAPLLQGMRLKQLYIELGNSGLKTLENDGMKQSKVSSLRVSLELSIEVLKKENPSTVEFFFLMGLLPGGVQEDEFEELYGDGWSEQIQTLLNFSLVQKIGEQSEDCCKYIQPCFMNTYAEAYIAKDIKLKFQNIIFHFYAGVCKKILNQNGLLTLKNKLQSSASHQDLRNQLLKHEMNIFACISRLVATDKNNENQNPLLQTPSKLAVDANAGSERFQRFTTFVSGKGNTTSPNQSPEQVKSNNEEFKSAASKRFDSKDQNHSLQTQSSSVNNHKNEENKRRERKSVILTDVEINEVEQLQISSLADQRRNLSSIQISVLGGDEGKSSNLLVPPSDKNKRRPNEILKLAQKIEERNQPPGDDMLIKKISKSVATGAYKEVFAAFSVLNDKREVSSSDSGLQTDSGFSSDDEQNLLDANLKKKIEQHRQKTIRKTMQKSEQYFQAIHEKEKENEKIDLASMKNLESAGANYVFNRGLTNMGSKIKVAMGQHLTGFEKRASEKQKQENLVELHAAEALILDYTMNLFLLNEFDNALNFITNTGLKVKGSTLYEAGLKRIQGLIWNYKDKNSDYKKAVECLKQSKDLYKDIKSVFGLALTNFAIGYVYITNTVEIFTKQADQKKINQDSQVFFVNAIKQFKEINHIVGIALCHKQLSNICTKLQQHQESRDHTIEYDKFMTRYNKYGCKKSCPYIPRIHGEEVSLLSQQVIDNFNHDMFIPEPKQNAPAIVSLFSKAMENRISKQYCSFAEDNEDAMDDMIDEYSIKLAGNMLQSLQNKILVQAQEDSTEQFLYEATVKNKQKSNFNKLDNKLFRLSKSSIKLTKRSQSKMMSGFSSSIKNSINNSLSGVLPTIMDMSQNNYLTIQMQKNFGQKLAGGQGPQTQSQLVSPQASSRDSQFLNYIKQQK